MDCSVVLKGLSIALNDLSYSKQELNRKENKEMLLQLCLTNLNDLTDLTVRTDCNDVTSSTNNHESLNVDSPIIQYNQHTWNGSHSPLLIMFKILLDNHIAIYLNWIRLLLMA